MSSRRLDEADDAEQAPGECELKALTLTSLDSNQVSVATEDLSAEFSSWSIGNSESFDEGEACGTVDDRTTSVAAFEQALERGDGKGFGNLLFTRVFYWGAGGVVDTEISSSTVTALSVTSFGGVPGDLTPATIGYGQTFFISHVNFADAVGTQLSFPLLFHDSTGCLGEDIDFDVYGSAVAEYGNSLGGNVTSVSAGSDDLDDNLVVRDRYNTILLSTEALNEYIFTQARCDLADAPVWTEEAGYAMCSDVSSDVTDWIITSDGGIVRPEPFPNVTTIVGGCPISVLPARFLAVGDFIDGSFESRQVEWFEHLLSVQIAILSQGIDALNSVGTAASSIVQSSTQVGFALPDANDSTEWVLVLVVAVESLFVTFSALAFLVFSTPEPFKLRGPTPRRERVMTLGTVFALEALLGLGLYPVFVAWASEREAADMAHNDVYKYTADATVCGEAVWDGDDLGRGEWCTALRTSSETLLVRSYTSTFEGRYAGLAIASTVLGGASWLAFSVLKFFFVERPSESPSDGSEAVSSFSEIS